MAEPLSPRTSTFQTSIEATKHPLVVLVAATVLGSVLVPYVNARIAQQKRLNELKINHAIRALRSSSDSERRINQLETEFAIVAKNTSWRASDVKTGPHERLIMLYAEFNREAWWWYWDLLEEVRLLRLVDESSVRTMRLAIDDYTANLRESTDEIGPLWDLLTSGGNRPDGGDLVSTLASSSARLQQLRQRRQETVRRMIAPLTR